MQEAWRLEAAEEAAPNGTASEGLRYAGVVYNEMKGAYSSPDSIVGEWAIRSLFPDTPYQFDSAGTPGSYPPHPRVGAAVPCPLLPSVELPDLPLR